MCNRRTQIRGLDYCTYDWWSLILVDIVNVTPVFFKPIILKYKPIRHIALGEGAVGVSADIFSENYT